jgi:hypothetical protein
MSKISTSLIITTYNWKEALELVLLSVLNQKKLPEEVIIADDGSNNNTKLLINKFQKTFPVPLIHIWHEDKGFRRSSILNLAISKSKGDYIIQLDGDCITHPFFVKDHIDAISKGRYLYGSRVNIQESFLKTLFSKKIVSFSLFSKGIKKRGRNIHLPFLGKMLYKQDNVISKKLRGCNLSYWKSDFIKINGYNEDMTGWGREDSEFVARLINLGIVGQRLKYRGIIYHIWHKESSKDNFNINDDIQKSTILNNSVWCVNGIDRYLN